MYLILVCKGLYILLVHICCAVDSHYFLEKIQEDGKDKERFEYTYDTKGNWIERKNYKMKNGKWEFNTLTRRTIEYRN